jgi:hypothetical protein
MITHYFDELEIPENLREEAQAEGEVRGFGDTLAVNEDQNGRMSVSHWFDWNY